LTEGDPIFLPGVEFSCRDEDGKYHILGYGYDPASESMRSVVAKGHRNRMNKVRARLDFLQTRFGFRLPEEELKALFKLDNPGKPHIGNLMVRLGYAKSKEDAIKNYIDQLRIRSDYLRPEEAIAGILGGGGIPVLAHPAYGSGDELIVGEELDLRVRKLTAFGLRGVEAYYSGFTRKLRSQALSLAERYDLYVTAGSDYHGKNKLVELGDTGLNEPDDVPDGMRRFLERVCPVRP
jgi:predicted metal-dependent phosphoesterase TrpH